MKLQEAMENCLEELLKQASIENRLTGAVKMANEERDPDYQVDADAKLMGDKNKDQSVNRTGAAPGAGAPAASRMAPPAALSPDAARQFRSLKPGGNATTAPRRATAASDLDLRGDVNTAMRRSPGTGRQAGPGRRAGRTVGPGHGAALAR